jgi:hypothetical protein
MSEEIGGARWNDEFRERTSDKVPFVFGRFAVEVREIG